MTVDRATGSLWARLRATRAQPRGAAATDRHRRAVYTAALEQAEQLFRAAATVGPATRPLLAFYGLSQAGRSIAAAASAAPAPDGWRLSGHGIKGIDWTRPLDEIEVHGDGSARGSFMRLSAILDSPAWDRSGTVRLGALWDTLPENVRWPLRDGPHRRLPLEVTYFESRGDDDAISATLHGLPEWVVRSTSPRADLDSYLAAYPEAVDYQYTPINQHPDAGPLFVVDEVSGTGSIHLRWTMPSGAGTSPADRTRRLETIARTYGRTRLLFPAVGTNVASLHPLMAWWSVLYALSMLARYQPAEWARHIDVNESGYAVPIERLLDKAVVAVPSLVYQTLDEVC
ncbi:hypothetical protein O7635_31535 [Asanoa sp. WMMD1127]|uniref:YaaC family protein n=1 Tax=Asanoa sp. WMMD1127 TaxID=3016107 RepID=UPI002415E8F5|nr:hypothetical protein [Asanoa sp. WMMD1127]MDG4826406.1 hypothetical protein [Asanoa sp. WMMD1127]